MIAPERAAIGARGVGHAGCLLDRALRDTAGHGEAARHLAFVSRIAIAVEISGAELGSPYRRGNGDCHECGAQ